MSCLFLTPIQCTFFLFNFLIWIPTHLCLWTHDALWAPMVAWGESEDVTVKAKDCEEDTNGILALWPCQLKEVTEYDISSQQELGEHRLTKPLGCSCLCSAVRENGPPSWWLLMLNMLLGSSSDVELLEWAVCSCFWQTRACTSVPCLWAVNLK